MKRSFIWAVSLGCLFFVSASAKDSTSATRYLQLLQTVPAPELATKSAELVKQAKSRDRTTATAGVIKAAVTINPLATLSVVGAIARSVPDLAAMAAGLASTEQPRQATAIAKTAATAAPSKAGKIVFAVCCAVPSDFRSVAIVVAQTVPGSAEEVVKAVALGMPELKVGVEHSLAEYSGNSISVAAVLDAAIASKIASETGTEHFLYGVPVQLPFIPRSETVRTIPPDTSGEVPTGGREQSSP